MRCGWRMCARSSGASAETPLSAWPADPADRSSPAGASRRPPRRSRPRRGPGGSRSPPASRWSSHTITRDFRRSFMSSATSCASSSGRQETTSFVMKPESFSSGDRPSARTRIVRSRSVIAPTGFPSSSQIGTNPMFSSRISFAQSMTLSDARQHFASLISSCTRTAPSSRSRRFDTTKVGARRRRAQRERPAGGAPYPPTAVHSVDDARAVSPATSARTCPGGFARWKSNPARAARSTSSGDAYPLIATSRPGRCTDAAVSGLVPAGRPADRGPRARLPEGTLPTATARGRELGT